MTTVHVIVKDIEGLAISACADRDGAVWLVINPRLPNPYHAIAEVMSDLVGTLPDACTYRHADLQLAS